MSILSKGVMMKWVAFLASLTFMFSVFVLTGSLHSFFDLYSLLHVLVLTWLALLGRHGKYLIKKLLEIKERKFFDCHLCFAFFRLFRFHCWACCYLCGKRRRSFFSCLCSRAFTSFIWGATGISGIRSDRGLLVILG